MNDVHIGLGCLNATFALFLKAVKYKNCFGKSHRVHRSVCSADIMFYNLQDTRTSKTFQHFG